MEPVAVLADYVGDLALPVEHEERHVSRGGLGQTKVTGSYFFTLQYYFVKITRNLMNIGVVPGQVMSKHHWDLCSQVCWH